MFVNYKNYTKMFGIYTQFSKFHSAEIMFLYYSKYEVLINTYDEIFSVTFINKVPILCTTETLAR